MEARTFAVLDLGTGVCVQMVVALSDTDALRVWARRGYYPLSEILERFMAVEVVTFLPLF